MAKEVKKLATLLLATMLTPCLLSACSTTDSTNDTDTTTSSNTATDTTSEDTSTDAVSENGLECDLDGWHYAYRDGEAVTGVDDADSNVLVVIFDLTNNTGDDDYVSAAAYEITAYQNGTKLSTYAIIYDESNSLYDLYEEYSENISKTITDSTTVELPVFIELEDTENPVTVEVGDLLSIDVDIA